MAKHLTPVDMFFIEHHKDKMSVEQIAQIIGCSPRTIYSKLNKKNGNQRTEQGREEAKGAKPETPKEELPTPVSPSLPPIGTGMDLIGKRKHGNSSAVVMTKEASELGDDIIKMSGTPKLPPHVHIMNPNKECQ